MNEIEAMIELEQNEPMNSYEANLAIVEALKNAGPLISSWHLKDHR